MNNTSYSYNITCPHRDCLRAICLECHSHYTIHFPLHAEGHSYAARVCSNFCPACGKLITIKQEGPIAEDEWNRGEFTLDPKVNVIDPREAARLVADFNIPEKVRDAFNEAAAVLSISPKASAALSRRLLQQVLRDKCGVKPQGLSREIDEFLQRTDIPTALRSTVDAIRHFGNFAAHPNKDKTTGEICDVEFG